MNSNWKPKLWLTILIGIVFQAFVFLYINRPKLFWLYFVLAFIIGILDIKLGTFFTVLLSIICPVHAALIIKRQDQPIKREWYSKWWFAIYLCLVISIFIIRAFLFEPFVFPSQSMLPTIGLRSHVIVSKLGYRNYESFGIKLFQSEISSPNLMQRGDLYAFYPPNKDTLYIKRLIGIPDDTISIQGKKIIINGSELLTDFLSTKGGVKIYQQTIGDMSFRIQHIDKRITDKKLSLTVPQNSYFFLGDNRENSIDSRYFGFVTNDRISGKVIYISN